METPSRLEAGDGLHHGSGRREGRALVRLVEEEEARVGEERARDARHLLLAAAQVPREPPRNSASGLMNVYTDGIQSASADCGHPMEDGKWSR